LRLPFSSPPTTRSVTVEVFDPASQIILGISLYSRGTDHTENTSLGFYPLLCDVTVYAEVCLSSRCLETGCITRCSTAARRGRHRKHSFIYCRLLDRVHVAVAWERADQICYNIIHAPTSFSSYWSLSFWLSHQNLICMSLRPRACCMPCPSHSSLLDHYSYKFNALPQKICKGTN
jgi:hypothetical protein